MDPRDRVQKLITLALDKATGESEARNAAMSACKLIVQHKLLEQGTVTGRTVTGRTVTVGGVTVDEFLRRTGAVETVADGIGDFLRDTLRGHDRPRRAPPKKPR
jgi:hypothetical protein